MITDILDAIQNYELGLRGIRIARSVIYERYDVTVKNIKSRTLLIWGEYDNITPANIAKKLNRLIKKPEQVNVPRCGHIVSQEKPDLFIESSIIS